MCEKISTLCARSVAAGAGAGIAVGMVGVGLLHHLGWRRAMEKGGGSAGAEGRGRSLREMNGTNGKTKGRKLWAARLRFGWFGLGFFCGECASDTP